MHNIYNSVYTVTTGWCIPTTEVTVMLKGEMWHTENQKESIISPIGTLSISLLILEKM